MRGREMPSGGVCVGGGGGDNAFTYTSAEDMASPVSAQCRDCSKSRVARCRL